MATSGSYDFDVTAEQIATDAMRLNSALDPVNEIEPHDRKVCFRFLNMIVKNIQKDADLWVTEDVTHTLTAGTQSYTVGDGLDIDTPRPLKLKHCRRQDSNGTDISVDVVSRQDYMEQPTKSTQSTVLMAYYDPQITNGVLYVWPTGTANNLTLILTFQRPIQDFDENGNNPDLPDEWNIWLVYQLAAMISPIYSGGMRQDLAATAGLLFAPLKNFDTEQVPINFQPDVK
jgi:hypothetical protein